MSQTLTVNDVLDGHVALDVKCLDRIYLNGYVPKLQVAGQVVGFMTRHLGFPIPSPAIMERIGTRFRRAVSKPRSTDGPATSPAIDVPVLAGDCCWRVGVADCPTSAVGLSRVLGAAGTAGGQQVAG
jgi:hypothetical protein